MQNLFLRFALKRHLNTMTIFKGSSSYPQKVFDKKLPPSPAGLTNGKYDIYCEHSIYNEGYLMTKLHTDTVNVAIIREPMSHLRSAFNHAGFYLFQVDDFQAHIFCKMPVVNKQMNHLTQSEKNIPYVYSTPM